MKFLVEISEKYGVYALISGFLILAASSGMIALSASSPPVTRVSATAPAKVATGRQVAAKVNMMGRQRMLTQRMVKAACLEASGIDAKGHRNQLIKAHDIFKRAHRDLRDGSKLLDLPAETAPEVLVAMMQINPIWTTLEQEIKDALQEDAIAPDRLISLDAQAEQLMTAANAATSQAAQTYDRASKDLPLLLTLLIDIAGRQRMLIERAVKNTCLMRNTQPAGSYQRDLSDTVALFDTTLNTLRAGDPELNIPRATDPLLTQQLAVVAKYWPAVKRTLDKASNRTSLSDEELATLARRSETLLDAVDRVVKTYEGLRRL